MADIKDGFSLTKKVGQDLLTVQGTDYATFEANVRAFFGPAATEVLGAFTPITNPQQVAEAITPSTPSYEPTGSQVSNNGGGEAATSKQQDFLWKVAGERNLGRTEVLNIAAQTVGRHIDTVGELSKREASAVIDAIKG